MHKNWDRHVRNVEQLARSAPFRALRDHILELARPSRHEATVDIGAGTGLLTMALAERAGSVWAIDVSSAMCEYLHARVAAAGVENVEALVASAARLPLPDASVDLVVSNYCFHHLNDRDEERALAEVHRVLRPCGRFVFADMMFGVGLVQPRDRKVVTAKIARMLRKGPPGFLRLARNAGRFLTGRWERPARPDWWEHALTRAGFTNIDVHVLEHEGGVAFAIRP